MRFRAITLYCLSLLLIGAGCTAGQANSIPISIVTEVAIMNPVQSAPPTSAPLSDTPSPTATAQALPSTLPPVTSLPDCASLVLKVFKDRRLLEVWDGTDLLAQYSVGLGFEPNGHKQAEGDGRTPEGTYFVCVRNSKSSYYKSLGVSYPNKEDAEQAYADGRITKEQRDSIKAAIDDGRRPPWDTPLGGEIMIHGNGSSSDWTAGCIAVEDDVMDVLWPVCKLGTRILIYP
jgi:hypothetical protein